MQLNSDIMEINISALEGLQLVADSIAIPDQSFKILNESLFEIILSGEDALVQESMLEKLPGVDGPVLKECFYGLATLLVESVKTNTDESDVSALLEECKWTPDRVDLFTKLLKINRKDIQTTLARLDSTYPHIVDVDWRLDYCIKSNYLEKINQSSYLISLKTQEPGKHDSLEFSCSVEQLQDLVGKLKDATKSIEKASQS